MEQSLNECIRVSGEYLYLNIKVIPGASCTQLAGAQNGRLRVKVAAPPEGGKANAALCAFLARLFNCSKHDIFVKTGAKSRLKTIAMPLQYQKKLETIIEAQ